MNACTSDPLPSVPQLEHSNSSRPSRDVAPHSILNQPPWTSLASRTADVEQPISFPVRRSTDSTLPRPLGTSGALESSRVEAYMEPLPRPSLASPSAGGRGPISVQQSTDFTPPRPLGTSGALESSRVEAGTDPLTRPSLASPSAGGRVPIPVQKCPSDDAFAAAIPTPPPDPDQRPLPQTRNTSPLVLCINNWLFYLALAHKHFCTSNTCPGLRPLRFILDTDAEDPLTPPPLSAQCSNAIEGELLITDLYYGVRLVPRGTDISLIPPFDLANYPCHDVKISIAINATMTRELEAGWLFTPDTKPRWITPIYGKDESTPVRDKIRIITDFSVPDGCSINDYAANQKFKMMQSDDTCALMQPFGFMAKVDLADAYRTVGVLPAHWELLSFRGPINGVIKILSSSRLVFGSAQATESFCRPTQATRAILEALGIPASVVFSDDFWIITGDEQSCQHALNILLFLLEQLGWTENIKKRLLPSQDSVHCGIRYETNADGAGAMRISIPPEKMQRAQQLATQLASRDTLSVQELQSAIGIFCHLAVAVWTGRTYLRRLITALAEAEAAGHKTIKVSRAMRLDFRFWQHAAHERNGQAIILQPPPSQSGLLATDASDLGMGGYFNGECFSVPWTLPGLDRAFAALPPLAKTLFRRSLWPNQNKGNSMWFIAYRETFAVYWAWLLWGPTHFRHRLLLHHVDNTVTRSAVNKLKTKHNLLMNLVRHMAELQVDLSMHATAAYITSERNYVADAASRMDPPLLLAALERLKLDVDPLPPPFLDRTFSHPCFLTHRAEQIRRDHGF